MAGFAKDYAARDDNRYKNGFFEKYTCNKQNLKKKKRH